MKENKIINGVNVSLISDVATILRVEHLENLDILNEEEGTNRVRISFAYCGEGAGENATDSKINIGLQNLLSAAANSQVFTTIFDLSRLDIKVLNESTKTNHKDVETWLDEEVRKTGEKLLFSTIVVQISELCKTCAIPEKYADQIRVKNEDTNNVFSSMHRSYFGTIANIENGLNKIISTFEENVDNGTFTFPDYKQPENNGERRQRTR